VAIATFFVGATQFAVAKKAPAADAVRVRCDSVFVKGDSLVANLHLETHRLKVRRLHALTVVPVINASQQTDGQPAQKLAPVVYSGRQRARFDLRAETVNPTGVKATAPYAVYKPTRRSKTYVTNYSASTLYESWMKGGNLDIERWWHDCCSDKKQSTDRLASNILSQEPEPEPEVIPVAPEEWKPNAANVSRMVNFIVPEVEAVKKRSESVSAHIDFKQGSYQIFPDFGRNPRELMVVDTLVRKVTGNDLIKLNSIDVVGYASPEGLWTSNDKLARNRSISFKGYLVQKYDLPESIVNTSSVAEDWDGLTEMLRASNKPYKDQVLNIIETIDIFDYREKKIMLIQNGGPYKEMLKEMFPPLRRLEVKADYEALPVPEKQLREMLFTRPGLLSLDEMFRATAGMTPGTAEYQQAYEIAARYFPNDVIANNNAAAASLLNNDLTSAKYYLQRTGDDARAYNNRGVLAYLQGEREDAAEWFKKAADAGYDKGNANMKYVAAAKQ